MAAASVLTSHSYVREVMNLLPTYAHVRPHAPSAGAYACPKVQTHSNAQFDIAHYALEPDIRHLIFNNFNLM